MARNNIILKSTNVLNIIWDTSILTNISGKYPQDLSRYDILIYTHILFFGIYVQIYPLKTNIIGQYLAFQIPTNIEASFLTQRKSNTNNRTGRNRLTWMLEQKDTFKSKKTRLKPLIPRAVNTCTQTRKRDDWCLIHLETFFLHDWLHMWKRQRKWWRAETIMETSEKKK